MIAFLQSLDPRLFYLLVSAVTFGVIYAWRRFSFASWEAITKHNPRIQALPALLLSAFLSAMPAVGKPLLTALLDVVIGLFSGGLAIGAHHAMKKYNGGRKHSDITGFPEDE